MAKEILLYGDIYDYSAERFINAMNEINANEELTLRINSNGGEPNAMAGMIDKFKSHTGVKKIKIDGKAFSSAFFFALYTDSANIEASDLSRALVHRAAYPEWVESNPKYMTAEMWSFLDATNKNLRTALEARVNPEDFKKVTGKTIDEVFSNESRIDVFLSASQMKKLGLISKINKLTPSKMQAIEASFYDVAANYNGVQVQEVETEEITPTQASNQANQGINLNTKNRKMTADQLRAEHPDIYASIHASGVNQERERVKAILVYHSVDAQKSVELVNAGSELTPSEREAFNLKAIQAKEVTAIESASAPVVVTAPVEATSEANAELSAFEAKFKQLKGGNNA
jgi:ATP-dependent protease ClpP protease subunit